ncbi:MAG TPA: hypothetical protein VFM18_05450, partial [Methanosarcina sp.]|nr:hypothetical protein [Methanosarcina sp.]
GILSLTNTPGTGNQPGAEFQNVRNIRLKMRGNKIAKGLVWVDANCTGYLDIDASVGSVCQTTAGQSVITVASTSNLDVADFKLNFEVTPPSTGLGSINRLIDNPTQGITRTCRITGVDHATAATNSVNGIPLRTLTISGSPATILNTTGRPLLLWVQGGTVSAISRTNIKGRNIASTVVTGSNGTVSMNGDFTDLYIASTVVTFFNARGVSLGTGTVSSSSLSGGVTTITFDSVGVPASFASGMQFGILNTLKTIQNRTNGMIEMPQESVVQITYSSVPSCKIGETSY